jgi:hypothetical protein
MRSLSAGGARILSAVGAHPSGRPGFHGWDLKPVPLAALPLLCGRGAGTPLRAVRRVGTLAVYPMEGTAMTDLSHTRTGNPHMDAKCHVVETRWSANEATAQFVRFETEAEAEAYAARAEDRFYAVRYLGEDRP